MFAARTRRGSRHGTHVPVDIRPLPQEPPTRPPGVAIGPSRRSRWRRQVLRRVGAAVLVMTAAGLLLARLTPSATVSVAAARRDLPSGRVLAAGDLMLRSVPDGLVGTAAGTIDAVVGRRLAGPLDAGEIVTGSRLVPLDERSRLPPGTSPVHVVAADPGSVDLLAPGLRIDVLVSSGTGGFDRAPSPDAAGAPSTATTAGGASATTVTITGDQGALVLSVDPPAPAGAIAVAPRARGAVLALTPAEVRRVLQSSDSTTGALVGHLVLRTEP